MTIIHNTLIDAGHRPLANVYVEIYLLSPTAAANAYLISDGSQVMSRTVTRTDQTGRWSLTLIGNSEILPPNSTYKVIHRVKGWPIQETRFTVPDTGTYALEAVAF